MVSLIAATGVVKLPEVAVDDLLMLEKTVEASSAAQGFQKEHQRANPQTKPFQRYV